MQSPPATIIRHSHVLSDVQCAAAAKGDGEWQGMFIALYLSQAPSQTANRTALLSQLERGALLSGGKQWGCVQATRHPGRAAAFHVQVEDVLPTAAVQLFHSQVLQQQQEQQDSTKVHHADKLPDVVLVARPVPMASFIRSGHIGLTLSRPFRTTDADASAPPPTTASASAIEPLAVKEPAAGQGDSDVALSDDWFDVLAAPFKAAVHLGEDVVHGAEDVYKVVKGIATGSLSGKDTLKDTIGYNYDSSTGKAAATIALGDHISCGNCYMYADVGVTVSADIDNYELQSAEMVLFGDMGASVDSEFEYERCHTLQQCQECNR